MNERLPAWLEHELTDEPTTHANPVRPFLNWFLLRRARQRAAVGRYPASADRDIRRRVSVALEFLAWIDGHELTLGTVGQENIDSWIAERGSQRRYLIRYFLTWTVSLYRSNCGSGYAACEYSLISPLRTFLRRTRAEMRTAAGPVSAALAGRW
jgi:hypothetical protein